MSGRRPLCSGSLVWYERAEAILCEFASATRAGQRCKTGSGRKVPKYRGSVVVNSLTAMVCLMSAAGCLLQDAATAQLAVECLNTAGDESIVGTEVL